MSITYVLLAITGFIGSFIAYDEYTTIKTSEAKSK